MKVSIGTAVGFISICCSALVPVQSHAQDQELTSVTVQGHVYKPKAMKPDPEFVKGLELPDGFQIEIYDEGLSNTRMLTIGDESGRRLYVTRREQGDCLLLRDEDGDGRVDGEPLTVARKDGLHGITLHDGKAYVVTVTEVFEAKLNQDGSFGELQKIIDDLPDGGQHPNRTIAVGPDKKLYITVGSTCNACAETNKESATILQAALDGSQRQVFASGLRNTIGFGWHPESGEMWGMDHGVDWLGDDAQVEELNKLQNSKFYGWPYILGKGMRNPQDDPPPGKTMADMESSTTLPVLGYQAHSSPLQMAFYESGSFPAEFDGDAFIAMRGSWNRMPPSGYEVVRVDFDDQGKPQKFEPFITGFLKNQGDDKWAHYGRLAGLAIAPDGSAMFLADDENGVIYRITYGE